MTSDRIRPIVELENIKLYIEVSREKVLRSVVLSCFVADICNMSGNI